MMNIERKKQMQKVTTRLLLLAALCFACNACGIKGPLYIPEHKYPQTASASE